MNEPGQRPLGGSGGTPWTVIAPGGACLAAWILAATMAAPGASAAEATPDAARPWTDREGRTVEARLLGIEGRTAVVVLANGQVRDLPFDRLCDDDLAWIEAWEADKSVLEALPPARWPESVAGAGAPPVPVSPGPGLEAAFATRHFRFECDAPLRVNDLAGFARTAENVRALLASLPVATPARSSGGPHGIRLYGTVEAYQAAGGPPGTLGAYRRDGPGGAILLMPLESLRRERGRGRIVRGFDYNSHLLARELTRLVMDPWADLLPFWLREGLAEYVAMTPESSSGYHLSLGEREAAVRRRIAYYEQFDPDVFRGARGEQGSALRDWFLPPEEVMDLVDAERSFARASLAQKHRFLLSAALLTTWFLHYDGDGHARQIRLFMEDVGASERYFRTGGREGYLPVGTIRDRRPPLDEVRAFLQDRLLGGRSWDALQAELVATFARRGFRVE